jgi:UDP-N-acetylglucosamine 2-epimerase (non-hydrolysing)
MKHLIFCIVGARPNFTKISPIMKAIAKSNSLYAKLVHTGQHYDQSMKHAFFEQLQIPEPDIDLEVGSGSHAVQTAEIMKRIEPVLDKEQPAAILVVGDVNSTIACALVASKKGIPVVHVEAGLRSYDRTMPEEINRVLTDQISEMLFTTEKDAEENLIKEGIDQKRIHFVGNVMIDNLKQQLPRATPIEKILSEKQLQEEALNTGYALLTLHRPSNVDDPVILERLLQVIAKISEQLIVIFPVHPRTKKQIELFSLSHLIDSDRIIKKEPLGYLEMLGLMAKARVILTDSGGIQEESTSLGVPCLTLRENTERPITISEGTNTIVGTDAQLIFSEFENIMESGGKAGNIPEKWDGKAAERIVQILEDWLEHDKRA